MVFLTLPVLALLEKNIQDITIVGIYIDRARSARTDNRPDFQKMIKDSAKNTLNSMLKIVEGTTINIEVSPHCKIPFDTSKVTVIFSGAFSKMKAFVRKAVDCCIE